jgi:Predicted transcriptional regulators
MFGQRLNYTRKSKGFTAQQMANELQIALRSYRMYESGNRSPSLEMLVKIADTLEVSTDYLLCRDTFIKSHEVCADEH